jgi:hypothetical protein
MNQGDAAFEAPRAEIEAYNVEWEWTSCPH